MPIEAPGRWEPETRAVWKFFTCDEAGLGTLREQAEIALRKGPRLAVRLEQFMRGAIPAASDPDGTSGLDDLIAAALARVDWPDLAREALRLCEGGGGRP